MTKKRVLLIQGMGGSWVMFPYLIGKLQAVGFEVSLYTPQFLPMKNIRPHAEAVAKKCRELALASGQKVAVIGYSMGGLVAVGAIGWFDAGRDIDTVITLGSPFQGTPVAAIAAKALGNFYPALEEMSPGSVTLAELNALPSDINRIYCLGGKYDMLVCGPANAHSGFATKNIIVPATHLFLPFAAADTIISLLKGGEE